MHAPEAEAGVQTGDMKTGDIDAFARALIGLEDEAAIDRVLARPASAAWFRHQVLARAAHRLGDWWVDDEICFASVTLGMARLQRLFWTHGRADAACLAAARPCGLLLAAAPGEQHTFGLLCLVEDLRERGFEAALLPSPTREALLAAAASGRFAVLGLSFGSSDRVAEAPALISALRRAASRPLRILAGGPLADDPALADAGADEVLASESALDRLCVLTTHPATEREAA